MREAFARFSACTAYYAGTAWVFSAAALMILVWVVAGPFVGWSDQWHLWASSITTVITFLMVFVIQGAQNRQTAEIVAMLREMTEDLPDVDDARARDRAKDEERPS